MVALKTSFVFATVILGAASSVYAAPTFFSARSDLASRNFEDNALFEARFFDDEVDLEARDFEEIEEIFARDFFDDEEDLFAREDNEDAYYEAPPRTGLSKHPGQHLYDGEHRPEQHRGQQYHRQHGHIPAHHHYGKQYPHANSMKAVVKPGKLYARNPMHGDRVVIKPIKEHKTASGIVLPDTASEKPTHGTILAVGPGKIMDSHHSHPLEVKVSDRVLFGKYSGSSVRLDDHSHYHVLREADLHPHPRR